MSPLDVLCVYLLGMPLAALASGLCGEEERAEVVAFFILWPLLFPFFALLTIHAGGLWLHTRISKW